MTHKSSDVSTRVIRWLSKRRGRDLTTGNIYNALYAKYLLLTNSEQTDALIVVEFVPIVDRRLNRRQHYFGDCLEEARANFQRGTAHVGELSDLT